MHELNYYALYVSIMANVPPEVAFWRLGDRHTPGESGTKRMYADDDIGAMVEMQNDGWRLKDIGEMYGMHPDYVCRIMSDWRKAHGQQRKPNRHPRKSVKGGLHED